MDSSLIKLDSLIQCRVLDFRTLIRVNLRSFPRHTSQFLQNLSADHHLLNSVWTQQVIINLVQTVRVFPLVTFRPLLCIADCTYTPQIDTRHQISCILFLYQIRKRQIRSIRMGDMTSHHQREGTNTGGPQDIRIRSGLSTSLQCPLMNRPQLIHVVTLVRA